MKKILINLHYISFKFNVFCLLAVLIILFPLFHLDKNLVLIAFKCWFWSFMILAITMMVTSVFEGSNPKIAIDHAKDFIRENDGLLLRKQLEPLIEELERSTGGFRMRCKAVYKKVKYLEKIAEEVKKVEMLKDETIRIEEELHNRKQYLAQQGF